MMQVEVYTKPKKPNQNLKNQKKKKNETISRFGFEL